MSTDRPRDPDSFDTTHWSVVLDACRGEAGEAKTAFAALCETYWFPLYAYARRHAGNQHDAEDLTQGFFSELLEKRSLAAVAPERGRFRAYLLTAFKRFVTKERERAGARKRGGGRVSFSLDLTSADSRFRDDPASTLTPENLFDREWATVLLDRVTLLVREECDRTGKAGVFQELKGFLAGRQSGTGYAASAAALGISEGAAAVAAHRLRARYRELLRSEIARTVSTVSEVDDEIRELFAKLGS